MSPKLKCWNLNFQLENMMSHCLRVWAYIGFSYSIPDLGNSPKHANVIWLSHPEDNQLCESDVTSEDSSVHLQVGRMKWIIFGKESQWSSSDVWTKVNQSVHVFKQMLRARPRIPLANDPRTLQLTCIRKHTEFHIFMRKGGVHSLLKGNLALYTTWVVSTMSREGGTWLVERCIPDLLVGMAPQEINASGY